MTSGWYYSYNLMLLQWLSSDNSPFEACKYIVCTSRHLVRIFYYYTIDRLRRRIKIDQEIKIKEKQILENTSEIQKFKKNIEQVITFVL